MINSLRNDIKMRKMRLATDMKMRKMRSKANRRKSHLMHNMIENMQNLDDFSVEWYERNHVRLWRVANGYHPWKP